MTSIGQVSHPTTARHLSEFYPTSRPSAKWSEPLQLRRHDQFDQVHPYVGVCLCFVLGAKNWSIQQRQLCFPCPHCQVGSRQRMPKDNCHCPFQLIRVLGLRPWDLLQENTILALGIDWMHLNAIQWKVLWAAVYSWKSAIAWAFRVPGHSYSLIPSHSQKIHRVFRTSDGQHGNISMGNSATLFLKSIIWHLMTSHFRAC